MTSTDVFDALNEWVWLFWGFREFIMTKVWGAYTHAFSGVSSLFITHHKFANLIQFE